MSIVKSLNEFIRQPNDILKKCQHEPIEISGDDQSYVIMTAEYLRRLLADSFLANQLDDIFLRLRDKAGVSENSIMSMLEHE